VSFSVHKTPSIALRRMSLLPVVTLRQTIQDVSVATSALMFVRLDTLIWQWVNKRGQIMHSFSRNLIFLTFLAALLLPAFSFADVSFPDIPKGKGDSCVAPTDVIRQTHMHLLLHKRDLTMHEGIRTKQYSLRECLNCHVQPKADGTYPSIESKEHFCNACHSYAAVTIDCFQCHSYKPDDAR
jgi:hypothetical protein